MAASDSSRGALARITDNAPVQILKKPDPAARLPKRQKPADNGPAAAPTDQGS
jgi:hypothetical protein